MKMCKIIILIVTLFTQTMCLEKPDFIKLAEEAGLTVESVSVTTEDNYILSMFHIPGQGEAVLLEHGFVDSANTFILRGNNSLAYVLSKAGYDVWLGNCRGNQYSRSHATLNPDIDKTYWNFTMHEIAIYEYDLPVMIDHVLEKTGQQSLIAVGHSQGNAVFYALGSSRPEYNDKVKVFIALAPICFLNHIPLPLSAVIEVSPVLNIALKELGQEELLQDNSAANELFTILCSKIPLDYTICAELGLFPVVGYDSEELEKDFLENKVAVYYPSGTSRRNANHLAQISRAKKFQNYDFGQIGNLKRYGSLSPPEYDLSEVTMNVQLLAGKNDKLSTLPDVNILRKKLPNNNYIEIAHEKMNHYDFVWSRNMDKFLYNEIFSILNNI